MTVQELFEAEKIDKEFLTDLVAESDYWESAYNFVTGNWRRDVEGLSPKQGAWLTKILDDCIETRIERQ